MAGNPAYRSHDCSTCSHFRNDAGGPSCLLGLTLFMAACGTTEGSGPGTAELGDCEDYEPP